MNGNEAVEMKESLLCLDQAYLLRNNLLSMFDKKREVHAIFSRSGGSCGGGWKPRQIARSPIPNVMQPTIRSWR